MPTAVDICNMALLEVGVNPISSFSDNTQNAVFCNSLWPQIYKKVLYDAAPTFARQYIQMALLTEAPLYGFSYTYADYAGVLRYLSMNDQDLQVSITADVNSYEYDAWKVMQDSSGNKIICANVNPLQLEAVMDTPNTGIWSQSFIDIVVLFLASKLAFVCRADLQLSKSLKMEYEEQLAHMTGLDGTQGSQESLASNALTEIR